MHENIDSPIYRKIALDVAARIYNGELKEGERIHGRSTLAGEYNVSPETIRRAMNLLEDMQVIAVNQGSGIYIKSKKNAYDFIERFQDRQSVATLRTDINRLMDQKQLIEDQIRDIYDKIIDYSSRLKNINPINPLEVDIPDKCHLIGRTVTETKFWQNTGATIVGIRRNGKLILSPGPYAGFEAGDVILVVGDMGVLERIRKYMEE